MITSRLDNVLNTCLILLLLALLAPSSGSAQQTQTISLDQAIQMGTDYSHKLEASRGRYDYAKSKNDQTYDLAYPATALTASYYRLSDVPEWFAPGSDTPLFPVYQNS